MRSGHDRVQVGGQVARGAAMREAVVTERVSTQAPSVWISVPGAMTSRANST